MFASTAAVKQLVRREAVASSRVAFAAARSMTSLAAYEDFGKNVFTGKVADEYLKKFGSSGELLKDPAWVKNNPDVVADAVFDW